ISLLPWKGERNSLHTRSARRDGSLSRIRKKFQKNLIRDNPRVGYCTSVVLGQVIVKPRFKHKDRRNGMAASPPGAGGAGVGSVRQDYRHFQMSGPAARL